MKRVLTVSLLLLCSFAATARVLSYAPYSDRLSVRGDQRRTTRHFVLIETEPYDRSGYRGAVVLYDSKGVDGPRVIFPHTTVYAAALYQDGDLPPVILVIAGSPVATHISSNGGRSWRRVRELDGLAPHEPGDVDYGGPWTRGLSASVRTGTAAFPFVVSYRGGVYAIPRAGTPRLLVKTLGFENALLGQNREGTEFVIPTSRDTLAVVGLDGKARTIGRPLPDLHAAWIGPEGSVYAVTHWSYDNFDRAVHVRAIHVYRNRRSQLVHERACGDSTVVAVPTHDFRGAWISEACHGWTRLFRHDASGLKKLWEIEDDDAPEIEALHAGSSGETLLIQVHRPRAKQDLSFLDPALAVWRVGDPPPAEYDELFLKEGPDKGFVHLDVDKIADGDPFVFDSSFFRPEPPNTPVSPPLAGGDDVIQEWGVVRASLKQQLVLPGAIRTPDEWRTDLVIYNPLDAPQKVEVRYGDDVERVTIDAKQIRVIEDALLTLFGVDDGSGTLHFTPEAGVNVKARVYALRDGGTRGYLSGAIDFFNVASPRFPVTFAGAFPGSGFRTRFLLTDTTGGGTKADVTTAGAAGIFASESVVANGVAEEDEWSAAHGAMIVRPTSGMGIAGVVVVDERSGDATYFSPDVPATEWRTIPFVVSSEDLRTDLHLFNFSDRDRYVSVEVKPYHTTQWPRTQTYVLKPYESRIIRDPLKTLFNLTGIARLRYVSFWSLTDSTGVRVTARTYRTDANGGTSGTLVPPMNNFQSVTLNESLEILAPVGNLRVALGMVELSPNPRGNATKVRVTVYDERTVTRGSFEVTLPMSGGLVTEDIFEAHGITRPAAARIVIEPLDNFGLVSAYALLTDPVTEDTSFVAPALGAKK